MASWARRHATDVRWALAIFTAAFLVRLLYVLWNNPDPSLSATTDAWFYHHSAEAMRNGRGYIFPGHLTNAQTAYWPPGYTAVLAAVYMLPGPDIIAGKLLNVVLGALTCSGVFALGRLMWDRVVGIVAAVVMVLFPSHIFFSTLLLTETAYTFLVTLILLLGVIAGRQGAGALATFAIGLLIGATTLLRGEGLLLPFVLGVFGWAQTSFRSAGRLTALLLLGVAVMMGGWTLRNMIQLDAPIPINTGSSIVLSLGHWKGADGGGNHARASYLLSYYKEERYPEREVKGYRKRTNEALEYWATHPRHELELIPQRFIELYKHDHDAIDWLPTDDRPLSESTLDRLRWISDVYYFAVLAAALAGVPFWWREKRVHAALLLGLIGYVTALISLVFFGDQRYHTVLLPAFALLAAPALLQGVRALPGGLGRAADS
jgi:4-amino-4-deoxy-L-arabinose transferase-like glycosyltransferase